jgi:hypothetical protein
MNNQSFMNLIRTAALAAMAAVPGMCCTYSVSVPAIPAGGGVIPVYVSTQGACTWQVTHAAGWMSSYGSQSGRGAGAVYVYVAPDYGAARTTPVRLLVSGTECALGSRNCVMSYVGASTTAVQY